MTKIAAKTDPRSPPRRNLPAHERRQELLDAAVEIYAQKGLGITVQELADRVNVTQPLVHRYFPTKADLIAAIRDVLHNAHWDPAWREILADPNESLRDRLKNFYAAYLPTIFKSRWYRGFMFFALSDDAFAHSYLMKFKSELFPEIVRAARHEFGFPSPDEIAITEREIELIWGFHSTASFSGMRIYVYQMPLASDVGEIMADQINAYLAVVGAVMADVMPKAKGGARRSGAR
jgi:AcrR family transcriptional regulator